jgi:hypothetical protein
LNGFVTSIVKDIRFGVGCSKSNFDKSWMVTNGLYSGRISSWWQSNYWFYSQILNIMATPYICRNIFLI